MLSKSDRIYNMMLLLVFGLCWWNGAHSIIAQIASKMISREEQIYLEDMFSTWVDEGSLITNVSVWQDTIKAGGFQLMGGWHFCDTPVIAEGYEPASVERT